VSLVKKILSATIRIEQYWSQFYYSIRIY